MSETQPVRIEIYSDTICPWCYIGKRRFESALGERPAVEAQITWLPFQLNPDMPPEGMDRQSYLERKFGGADGAERIYAPIVDAGGAEHIAFNFDAMAKTPNTLNSHRLIHYAAQQSQGQGGVVEALFTRYFEQGEDVGDVEVLVACALDAGLDAECVREYLDGDEDLEKITSQDAMARQLGIQGVPFFVFDGKYAVSGAQPADVIADVFDKLLEEASTLETASS
jgi:predicted DsbA family dithiol-disulfide isomerase